MKVKTLSKFLTLGILLNSTPISSFAGVLSEDTRYETFSGSDITINNVLEEDNTNIKIEGNTLIINEQGEEVESGTKGAILKSSFEDSLVTQEMVNSGEETPENLGKYKVEYKSIGKNILPNDFLNQTGGGNPANGKLYPSMFGYTTSRCRSRNLIKVKPNTSYTVNCTDIFDFAIVEFDKNYRQISDSGWVLTDSNPVYVTSDKCSYIILIIRYIGADISSSVISINDVMDKIQLEEGSTPTEYEPYKEYINTFYLNSPLLEGDTIEYINGQAYHVRRRESVTLDGSTEEEWNYCDIVNPTIQFSTPIKNGSIVDDYDVISDKILPYYGEIKDSIWVNNSNIHIRLELSKLTEGTVDGFREWIINNPITVVYNLAKPIYEPIKADLSANLFEGTTHISNNSNIPTVMEITVDRVLNRAVEAIELAKTNPTVSNISKARMWINLLDDSIKKDELQNEINDITDIEDLQLERKTVTSNIDVYVKSQNMLLMSLSTNSITFNDFSGVEDMLKENAINISINSSLPYNLNAYLATEIQNSDGTNIMNKDIFSIKESSESNYQTFSDANNKLILKENCKSGNNQKHNVDLKLNGGIAHEKDVYKTVIKFEAEQQ